jgi:hypothetical protein
MKRIDLSKTNEKKDEYGNEYRSELEEEAMALASERTVIQ